MFGLFRRKPPKPQNPLAAYDAALEELSREGSAIRRSAATLLALRSELLRGLDKQRGQESALRRRIEEARAREDLLALQTLSRDLELLTPRLEANEAALAKAEADAATLTETAEALQRQQSALRSERESAHAQLALGQAIHTAFVAPARVERSVALDAARDEVERAHALAEIYREEQLGKLG
jgi:chromosome segregation ATPase